VSEQNVEIVKRIYESWGRDRSPAASGLFDPDIEWVNPADVRRWVAAFESAASTIDDTFDRPDITFEEFIDAGNDVVVIGVLRIRGSGSGVEFWGRQGYVWTIRNGKAIRYRWFSDPAEALQAAGLSA